ncbi:hypothetical protein L218DRAFT_415239 [Marasmius fiardii PR-910]|nr:hypothetical protein L218DRAFT_415239 [Marasmius fiardii PR-910]
MIWPNEFMPRLHLLEIVFSERREELEFIPEVFYCANDMVHHAVSQKTVPQWEFLKILQDVFTDITYGDGAGIFATISTKFLPNRASEVEKMAKEVKNGLEKSNIPQIVISHSNDNDISANLYAFDNVFNLPDIKLAGTLEYSGLCYLPIPDTELAMAPIQQYGAHVRPDHDGIIPPLHISEEFFVLFVAALEQARRREHNKDRTTTNDDEVQDHQDHQ